MSPRPAPLIREVLVTQDVVLAAGTETVVATVSGITTQSADERIALDAMASITGAAGVTGVTVRLRRTNLTGAIVGEAESPSVAGAVNVPVEITAVDAPGEVADMAYVLTALSTGGNSTAFTATLKATVGVS